MTIVMPELASFAGTIIKTECGGGWPSAMAAHAEAG
jgi:hypothetical protein